MSASTPSDAPSVGSVDRIITAADLRPYLGDALERGMARTDQDGRRASEVRVTLRQT